MGKHRYRNLFACFLAIILALGSFPVSARAASSSEIKKQIDALKAESAEIQKELDMRKRQYDESYNDMAAMVAQKTEIDQELTLLSNKIEATNAQITAYGQLIADTQDELDRAETELRNLSEEHRARIRAMEEQGNLTYWQVIFEATSFMEMLDRISIVEEISAADRRRIEQMRIAADLVTASRDGLEREKSALQETQAQLAADEEVLAERRAQSDELLYELEKKVDEFASLMEESEALQEELMQDIAAKEKEYKNAKYNEELARMALQGQNPPSNAKWVTPVSGYTISSPFGMRKHPILGTSKMHNGIDMACAQGTPIYATRAGTVTTASYQAGGAGNYVSINHLDGFSSIYMHMTNYVVSAGQSVTQGQLIGYVGSTGLSTGPHLHFGISYAGTYVNPLAYVY